MIPGPLDALCDRPFLGTHRCLELAIPNLASRRALTFLGGKRCGTLRPLPSRPLAPVSQLDAETSLSSTSSDQHWYFSPLLSLRERAPRVACPGCLYLADAHEEKKDAACWPEECRDCLRCTALALTKTGVTDRTFVAIHTLIGIGNGMSRASS
jgi:hypothetical protein